MTGATIVKIKNKVICQIKLKRNKKFSETFSIVSQGWTKMICLLKTFSVFEGNDNSNSGNLKYTDFVNCFLLLQQLVSLQNMSYKVLNPYHCPWTSCDGICYIFYDQVFLMNVDKQLNMRKQYPIWNHHILCFSTIYHLYVFEQNF